MSDSTTSIRRTFAQKVAAQKTVIVPVTAREQSTPVGGRLAAAL